MPGPNGRKSPASARITKRPPGIRVVGATTVIGPGFTQVIATTSLAKAKNIAKQTLKDLRKSPANAVIKRRQSFFSNGFIFTVFVRGKAR